MSDDGPDQEARLRAVEIVVRSIMIQSASQWGDDAKRMLDQWQAELTEHHREDAEALDALFEKAIRRFG